MTLTIRVSPETAAVSKERTSQNKDTGTKVERVPLTATLIGVLLPRPRGSYLARNTWYTPPRQSPRYVGSVLSWFVR